MVSVGATRAATGVGLLREWSALRGNLRPLHVYTGVLTPPGLGGGAPSGEHFRPERPPEHLRHDVFGGGCLPTHLSQPEGLVMAALGVHRIPKEDCQRG